MIVFAFDGPTPIQRTVDIASRAQQLGADQLCLADTIGTTTPGRVLALIDAVRTAQISLPLGAHFHNTRGSGLACAWAAFGAGVTMLDASIAGLGGCPFAPGASGNSPADVALAALTNSESSNDDGIIPVDLSFLQTKVTNANGSSSSGSANGSLVDLFT